MNTDAARFAGLRTPRWRERLLAALGAHVDAQGRVVLEFEIVYGHAFKPGAARQARGTDPGRPRRHEGDAEPGPSTPLSDGRWGRAYAESRRHFFGMNRP